MGKKIVNSKTTIYKGIKFKSNLEKTCYEALFVAGFNPSYESKQYQIVDSFKLKQGKYYYPKLIKKKPKKLYKLVLSESNINGIGYTPDFYFVYNNYHIFVETKGRQNESYPLRKKLFLLYLEKISKERKFNYYFFEPHSKKDIIEMIETLKHLNMGNQIKKIQKLVAFLPEKDRKKALLFLSLREFENLQDLVNSFISIIETNQRKGDKCPEKYKKIDIQDLLILKAEVDCYSLLVDPDNEIANNIINISDELNQIKRLDE